MWKEFFHGKEDLIGVGVMALVVYLVMLGIDYIIDNVR